MEEVTDKEVKRYNSETVVEGKKFYDEKKRYAMKGEISGDKKNGWKMSNLPVVVSINFCLQFTVTDFRRSDMNVCLILEEVQMTPGYVEGVISTL